MEIVSCIPSPKPEATILHTLFPIVPSSLLSILKFKVLNSPEGSG